MSNPHEPSRDQALMPLPTRRAGVVAHRRRQKKSRRRLVTWLLVSGCLLVLLGLAGWIGVRGLIAKDALEGAQNSVGEVQDRLTSGDGTIDGIYADLHERTTLAVEMTSDPIWWLGEQVPVVGSNLVAFRQTAAVVDDVVVNGIGPFAAIPGLSLDALKPKKGTFDIATVEKVVPALLSADQGLRDAAADAERIQTDGTFDFVAKAVREFRALLAKATALTGPAAEIAPLLPGALGADGPRNYLLLFQNNAEERSTGGNPASLALITLDQGKIDLSQQASSGDFGELPGYLGGVWGYAAPVLPLDPETLNLYGEITGAFVQNITFTPDFPTTAALAKEMWAREFPQSIDAVVSLDPVALSYLLKASGSIELSTGDVLESETAVDFLLSQVYAKYTDPDVQDQVFADAASGVFSALTSGKGSMKKYFKAAENMIEDGRFLLWSAHPEEQEVIADLPVAGIMPTTNDPKTTVGVFFNDRSVSKMSYYLLAEIDVTRGMCAPDGQLLVRTAVTVTNAAPEDAEDSLPAYVVGSGNGIDPGQILDYIAVYGPVGATFGGMSWDGAPITPTIVGTDRGRPVAILNTLTDPQSKHQLVVDMIGGTDATEDVEVRSTPRVRPTPTTVKILHCG